MRGCIEPMNERHCKKIVGEARFKINLVFDFRGSMSELLILSPEHSTVVFAK